MDRRLDSGDDGGTGCRVRFMPDRIVARAVPVQSTDFDAYRENPPLTTPEA
jgi:hypothetical protein